MNKVTITKEADTFYFTYGLMKTVRFYIDYLKKQKAVHSTMKSELNHVDNRLSAFIRMVDDSLPDNVVNIWKTEWEDKDYMTFSQVLRYMSNMSESNRAEVESLAEKLWKGENGHNG